MRLHLRPLGVAQNESVHPKLESQSSLNENPESQQTLVQEVFGLLQIMQARDDDLLHFASEPLNVVNAANCELWLHDDGAVEARPHDPATGMRHVLNVSYIPKANCPEYYAAVRRIFENAKYPQTLLAFFEELMGYAIQLRRDIALIGGQVL